jgi:hypothetical protein
MRKAFCFALSFACLLLAGCLGKPLLPCTLGTPPLTLLPASQAGIEDGRGRFREIYCAVRKDHGKTLPYDRPCEEVVLRLEGEPALTGRPVVLDQPKLKLRYLLVPGLYSDCIETSKAFSYARAHVERLGYRAAYLAVSGWSSSAHNAGMIRDALRTAGLSRGEKAVLIGYSKGVPDILQALVEYPEIAGRVAAVVSIAGAVGGTPLTESMGELQKKIMGNNPIVDCPPGVGDPIASLQRSTRQLWLSQNRLPLSVKYFSLAAFADRENISTVLQVNYDRLAQIDPRNDSQLLFYDQLIPGGTLIGYVRADHWAVAMPFSQDRVAPALIDKNEFPREVLLEAVIRFVEEELRVADR